MYYFQSQTATPIQYFGSFIAPVVCSVLCFFLLLIGNKVCYINLNLFQILEKALHSVLLQRITLTLGIITSSSNLFIPNFRFEIVYKDRTIRRFLQDILYDPSGMVKTNP